MRNQVSKHCLAVVVMTQVFMAGCSLNSPFRYWDTHLVDEIDRFNGNKPFVLYETITRRDELCYTNLYLIVKAQYGKDYLFIQRNHLFNKGYSYHGRRFYLRDGLWGGESFSHDRLQLTSQGEIEKVVADQVIDLSLISDLSNDFCGCWVYCSDRGIDIPTHVRQGRNLLYACWEIRSQAGRLLGEFSSYNDVIDWVEQELAHSKRR